MKKSVFALMLASFAFGIQPAAQEDVIDERTQQSYNLLISQYATASLGFYIEQRCRQLAEPAFIDFAKNQQLINSFMVVMMGLEANTRLLEDIQENANNQELNPCDSATFKFANQASTVASTLATRVRLLSEEEIARLNRAMTGGGTPADQSPAGPEESPQTETGQEAVADTQPATPAPSKPKTTFEPLTPTYVERRPETKKPQPETTSGAEPQPETQTQTQATQETAQAAGVVIGDYVNPYPYSAPPPPPGETEKQMKRRQRQEIIDLRRAHRAEKDAFKDNEDNYADPDAVKDYIKDRQDAEFDAMRERHDRERDRY